MICSICKKGETSVVDSRPTEDGTAIRRRRLCVFCNARFTTFERVQFREIMVIKKNGRKSAFDRDKLSKSIYSLAYNTIGDKDHDLMIDFLKKRKTLNQSKVTKTFENKFSKYLGVKYTVFVNSGSSANLLIAQSLLEGNYLKNKIVIVPSVSWSTSVSPFLQLGYKVILCDCDKNNLGLDTKHLEKLCSKYNPGLIVLVNVPPQVPFSSETLTFTL